MNKNLDLLVMFFVTIIIIAIFTSMPSRSETQQNIYNILVMKK